jgi:hypothetical protein
MLELFEAMGDAEAEVVVGGGDVKVGCDVVAGDPSVRTEASTTSSVAVPEIAWQRAR